MLDLISDGRVEFGAWAEGSSVTEAAPVSIVVFCDKARGCGRECYALFDADVLGGRL